MTGLFLQRISRFQGCSTEFSILREDVRLSDVSSLGKQMQTAALSNITKKLSVKLIVPILWQLVVLEVIAPT